MALNARNAPGGGKEFPKMEAGTYPCRVVHVLDLGKQPQRPWQGQEKPPADEMALTYEFVDEFMVDEDGEPMEDKPRHLTEIFVLYNLDAEKAKSTARYHALDPNEEYDGDWTKLINTPCMVTVVINPSKTIKGKTYENIAEVSPMRAKDAEKCPELINPARVLDLGSPDIDVFRSLPKWQQEKIASNLEFAGSDLEKLLELIERKGEDKPADNNKEGVDEDENPY